MIKSIDTFYNGNYFRSRLEARWAHFFDVAEIKYQYEPKGFTNGKERYLPDFYLPEVSLRNDISTGVYIEIKNENYDESDFKHGSWFEKNLCLFKGQPAVNIWSNTSAKEETGYQEFPYWDNCMKFWKCSNCGKVKIEFWDGNYNYCPLGKHISFNGIVNHKTLKEENEIFYSEVEKWCSGMKIKIDCKGKIFIYWDYENIPEVVEFITNMTKRKIKKHTTLDYAAECASIIRFEHK